MMNSRKSWVNIPLLKNIIKNNLFPAKVSLIIFVGVFILSLISGSNSGFSQICIVVYGISAVVLTTIYPCFIQSYQVNKTKSSMMCSLPLTTRCVWFTNYLAGYLIALVTLLIEGLGLMMFLGLNNAGTEGNIFIRFIMAIFLLLFIYYTLTYLVCSLSGNRLGQVVFSLAAYALPVILLLGLIYISPKLVPSNLDLGINDTYLYLTFPLAAGMQFIYSAYPHIFFHLFLGIVTLICSYYVYKNRENEYIGEPLVFRRIIIVLKAILIIAVTICGFGVILLVSKINITYGFKGQSLLFLIYILIGMIVAIIVEIIFKGRHVYRNLLIYVPVLAIVFGANFMIVNKQYLSGINNSRYEVTADLVAELAGNQEYLSLSLNNEVTKEFLNYLSKHRDDLHFEKYDDEQQDLAMMYTYQYEHGLDDDYYSYSIYYINKKAVIDFFNGPGNKYFDKLLNYTEGLKKEKSLICYVNDYAVYLNKEEIQELIKLLPNQEIKPKNIFSIKTYNLLNPDSVNYLISSNEAITNFITSDELIERAVFIENCRDVIDDINSDSTKFEEQIKAVVSSQFSHETIDMVYPNGDSTVIAFGNDEVIYQGTYEVVTKEGNNYTYPLEFTLKKGDDGVIVNDIKVGG